MAELEKTLEEIQEHLKASRSGFKDGWTYFHSAEQAYQKAAQERLSTLQEILEREGLAVCSLSYIHLINLSGEAQRNPSLEQLGVFPKDRMRLFLDKGLWADRDEEGYQYTWGGEIQLVLLCPEHFPGGPNRFEEIPDGTDYYVRSEVLQEDGKFIIAANQKDITEFVVNGKGKSGRDTVEPNGRRFPEDEIYRYFGIPDLPQKPKLDSVRRGR